MDSDRKYSQRGYQESDRNGSKSFPNGDSRKPQGPRPPLDLTGPRLPRLVQAITATRCHSCATQIAASTDWNAACPKCGAKLHCCKQCAHFEPSTRFQCVKPGPVRLPLKDQQTECGLFSPRVTVARDAVSPVSRAPVPDLTNAAGNALRRLTEAGAAVALSSGHHPVASPGFSMQMAISLAIVQGQLTPEQAISAATVNAAYAAGRGAFAGTLESGKRGDILVMNVPDYRDIARQFGINHVVTVLRSGQVAFNQSRRKMVAHEPAPARVRAQHIGRA